ncbi:hypothetical protein PspLS_07575 [Pyricularia sp. CBS 133598]|nr:hypothetical protein PspLS_07575 [Pyricularia sp. CBS 133598]
MTDDAGASSTAGASGQSSRPSGSGTRRRRSDSVAQRRKAGLQRKFQFMTSLMMDLDSLVYAEICLLYYMDVSIFRLLIRLAVQSFFLSPKSDEFVLLMPTHRPHTAAVLVPNLFCMLMHLLWALPKGSEASRGYLHGGVVIDFIGEKAPTSKLKLLLLDAVILTLQCVMVAVHSERERLRAVVKPRVSRLLAEVAAGGDATAGTRAEATMEAYDAEERGVARDGPHAGDAAEEMDPPPLRSGRRPPDMRDYMMSGNAVIGDFHVLHSVRTVGHDYQAAAAQSLQTIGFAAELARLATRPGSRLARLGAVQRRQQQQQQQQQQQTDGVV